MSPARNDMRSRVRTKSAHRKLSKRDPDVWIGGIDAEEEQPPLVADVREHVLDDGGQPCTVDHDVDSEQRHLRGIP
jgi:hypothetical protein